MAVSKTFAPMTAPGALDPPRRLRHNGRDGDNDGDGMSCFLTKFFTWWNGQTLRHPVLHLAPRASGSARTPRATSTTRSPDGARRWVIYNGEAEASRVSPEWHGWLHHTYQEPPTAAPLPHKPWEKPHVPNLTGSALAYRPPGSILVAAARGAAGLRGLGAGVGAGWRTASRRP